MKLAYTDRPWEALLQKPSRRDPQGTAMVRAGGTMLIDCTKSGDTWDEVAGNCMLIAAAPNLAKALRKIAALEDKTASPIARAAVKAAGLDK